MQIYEDWSTVVQALGQHYYTRLSALPDGVQTLLTSAFGRVSPVERAGLYCEILYASAALLDNPEREVCGGLAHYLGSPDRAMWLMQVDERGRKIFAAMRRMNGEDGADQAEADDPAPLPQYVIAPADPEV
jgi:hypothetical protein